MDGKSYSTLDIAVTSKASAVKSALERDCSFLKDKIDVTQLTDTHSTKTMGIEYQVHFKGIKAKIDVMSMKSSFDDPVVGKNVEYAQEETRPFGQSLIYPLIPAEHFYTVEDKPQIMVQIDEFPALCRHLNCAYKYKSQESVIKSFTVTDLAVVLTAEKLRTENVTYTVELAKTACAVATADADKPTETQIKCTLAAAIPSGKWLPKVTDEFGLIKLDPAVSPHEVALDVTDISPKSGLNPAGGNLMTIKAT